MISMDFYAVTLLLILYKQQIQSDLIMTFEIIKNSIKETFNSLIIKKKLITFFR